MSYKKLWSLWLLCLILSGCGNPTNKSEGNRDADFYNGYHLTGITAVSAFEDQNIDYTTEITHDFSANTSEWLFYVESGELLDRTLIFLNARGQTIKSERYDSAGALLFTREYTFEDGLLVHRIDSRGSELRFTYDNNANLVMREDVNSVTGSVNQVIEYTYDDNGHARQALHTTFFDTEINGEKRISRFFTNDAGQIIREERYSDLGDTLIGTSMLDFDENGNLISRKRVDIENNSTSNSQYEYAKSPQPIVNNKLRNLKLFFEFF